MKTHRNIPFFVPHAGCPNCCVFCSQRKITGVSERDPDEERDELYRLLSAETGLDSERQIAFFGGSFTAIERERMVGLLEIANEFVRNGRADSIRISTRPDAIDEEILTVLRDYGVRNIEIGVQSTDSRVLERSNRGHSPEDSFNSAKMILDFGFELCGQMMVGLPSATYESELKTAFDIVAMGATEARIYPTVVFEGTRLFEMAEEGIYKPLTTDSAVERTAGCARVLIDAGVKLLRIGLHESENLQKAPMGANHPALGELVRGRIYAGIISDVAGDARGKRLSVGIPKNDISMLTGHGGIAKKKILELTGASEIELYACDSERFTCEIKVKE